MPEFTVSNEIYVILLYILKPIVQPKRLPRWHNGKNLPANAGDTGHMGRILGSGGSPWRRKCNPFQYSCLENFMNRGTWRGGDSPWDCKQSDTTELCSTYNQNIHQISTADLMEEYPILITPTFSVTIFFLPRNAHRLPTVVLWRSAPSHLWSQLPDTSHILISFPTVTSSLEFYTLFYLHSNGFTLPSPRLTFLSPEKIKVSSECNLTMF